MSEIRNLAELRSFYRAPTARALGKVLPRLDEHCIRFIGLSPFCVLASTSPDGSADLSPRGGNQGFVRVLNSEQVELDDRPGNNRLDTLSNIVERPEVSLLFMVPGVDETLRVYGVAKVLKDSPSRDSAASDRGVRVEIRIRRVYFQCAKALMRSKLWDASARVPRDSLPSLGQILKDQMKSVEPAESQADMVRRYQTDL